MQRRQYKRETDKTTTTTTTNNKQTKREALNVSSYGVQHLCRTKTSPILIFSKGGNESGVLVFSDDRLTFFAFFALIVLFLLVPFNGRSCYLDQTCSKRERTA